MDFAKRMEELKPSDIREVGKMIMLRPGTISFAGGLPDPKLFPVEEMKIVTERILREKSAVALQYGATLGQLSLREKIAKLMLRESVCTNANNIAITTGSQQAISLSTMMFLNPGDVIITENPSYLGALTAFKPFQCNIIGVNCDDYGMIMKDLERVLENTPEAKMVYVIPNFQNPTGRTWSLERRKKLVELAIKFDLPIIEDNAYGEIRFEGERVPSIKSLDVDGRVIHLGSFSKILSPGLRVGWVCAEENIITKYELLKQGGDLQSNELAQMQVDEFLNSYDLDEHIEKIKAEYKIRRDLMLNIIKEEFPTEAKYYYTEGGMFLWIELPSSINTRELLKKAIDKGVAFVPGGSFYPNGGCESSFRINFSNMERDKILEGMKILADLLKAQL